jgi:hypothetical protein
MTNAMERINTAERAPNKWSLVPHLPKSTSAIDAVNGSQTGKMRGRDVRMTKKDTL